MQIRPLLAKLDSVADLLQSPLLLVIRLYWGWQFVQTGYGKLTNLGRTTGFLSRSTFRCPR